MLPKHFHKHRPTPAHGPIPRLLRKPDGSDGPDTSPAPDKPDTVLPSPQDKDDADGCCMEYRQ